MSDQRRGIDACLGLSGGHRGKAIAAVLHTNRLLACVSLAIAAQTRAAVVIYGGPTDSPPTITYQNPIAPTTPGSTAGSGVGVGYTSKFSAGIGGLGERAFRWDASGWAELGNLGTSATGATDCRAYAVNATGVTVGSAQKSDAISRSPRAVRWDAGGIDAVELGNLGISSSGKTSSAAYAINGAGTAVGYAEKYPVNSSARGTRAVRWNAGTIVATELGNLGTNSIGSTTSAALAINAGGTAVGYAQKYSSGGTDQGQRAVRWNAGGTAATELANLGTTGGTVSTAYAINTAGTAVGYAEKISGTSYLGQRAVRWEAGGTNVTELGGLGVSASGETYSYALAVNDNGVSVGYANKYSATGSLLGTRAVRWNASGTSAIELGQLGTSPEGVTNSRAYAINSAGISVGYAQRYDDAGAYVSSSAVAWGTDNTAIDLNDLLPTNSGWVNLHRAAGISDAGWITGVGSFDPDGVGTGQAAYDRLFVLQIPEPSVIAAAMLPIVMLMRSRRRCTGNCAASAFSVQQEEGHGLAKDSG